METPETIRLSLQKGEWVTSLDFSDACFHIPINPRSRKYLRFHLHGQTFQFRALPFGLATAPLEFTKVVKKVKLMAQSRGIRIHQYLDDWLLRAPCRETCVNQTQTLMALCQQLGWLVNLQKSELVPQQEFNFVGYHFDLSRVAHKLSRAKSGPSGPQEVRATVLGPDHFDSHGQHNGCLIHQQGGGYEIRLTLCPPLETAFLVQSQTDSSKGQAHSGKAECDSRQIVQDHSGYSDRMVPPAGSLRPLMC